MEKFGGDIMGGFCPGGFCPGGFCPRGDFVQGDFVQGDFVQGICPGGFCSGGFCPRTVPESCLNSNFTYCVMFRVFLKKWQFLATKIVKWPCCPVTPNG